LHPANNTNAFVGVVANKLILTDEHRTKGQTDAFVGVVTNKPDF
jgi:hypothetical protein